MILWFNRQRQRQRQRQRHNDPKKTNKNNDIIDYYIVIVCC